MEIKESIVCPGCGCLCDDLDVTVEHNRVVEAANICLWGAGKFFAEKRFHPKKARGRLTEPMIKRRGRWEAVSYDAALSEAASILGQARQPVVYGLTNSGSWAQEAAFEVARRAHARLEPADLAFQAPYYQALRQHKVIWAPLEVIRDEADAIVFWGANPIHSCPRHTVRYSAFARGRFTEGGLEERRVAAVDIYRTEMAHFCHLFVQVEPDRELEFLQGVSVACASGLLPERRLKGTKRLVEMLTKATYGVIFVGRGVRYGPAARLWAELARLVGLLSDRAPFILFPLSTEYNSCGLYSLLLRAVGSPLAPEFHQDGETRAHSEPLDFRQTDAVMVTGADLCWNLAPEQVMDLHSRRVPLVVFSPFVNQTTVRAQVVFPVALEGVETPEIAYRMDGLPVALKKVVDSPFPATHVLLQDLAARL